MTFSALGLHKNIVHKLNTMGLSNPTPIQAEAIPVALQRKDIMGIAPTGSGKTLSFALPSLINLARKTNKQNRHIDVLVLVPTRELAIQILAVYKDLEPSMPEHLQSLAVYGGVSINPQMQQLQNINVLIATPGRLIDLLEKNALSLAAVSTLILDEADKLLNLGFEEELQSILKLLPAKRQTMLYSATLTPKVEDIKGLHLHNPTVIKIEEKQEQIADIEQLAFMVNEDQKGPTLRKLMQDLAISRALIFTSTTHKAERVAAKLVKNGISARAVHGKKTQGNRNASVQMFKNGEVTALVTTDLLGRGIQIDDLPYVVNYELPRSPKDYIHRIGRTGRAGKSGRAITLFTPAEEPHFYVIQKKMGKRVDITDLTEEI